MASVIFTAAERKGLDEKDIALLHEHVLHCIQTSPEIRQLIKERRAEFVRFHPRVREVLRKKASPLLQRLKRQAAAGAAGGGRRKKGGGRKKKR
jgi:hypothetical protein